LNFNVTFWQKIWHLKKKVDQQHISLQAFSQTSFLYNKYSLLILLFYNLFIWQLSMARWQQQQ
jgi:hypothetical protein